MEQLDHLIEILVQIVLVEHKYGLGHGQKREGMVGNAGFENRPESDMEFMHTRIEMRKEGI